MIKTAYFESAVRNGFYSLERPGLFGKKDNVRKYWEDISIKMMLQPVIAKLLRRRKRLRVVDLGAGSGEGFELLTHIPVVDPLDSNSKPFLLAPEQIQDYVGVDISPAMVEQGRHNYRQRSNVRFIQADLAEGFPLKGSKPFDIYFSSYSSLSHLSARELEDLIVDVMEHAGPGAVIIFDLFGRLSPEWPIYWDADCRTSLPYTMAYLLPPEQQTPENVDWYHVTFWTGSELRARIQAASIRAGRDVQWMQIRDRSILVGRHMDTALFKDKRFSYRYQINRLFDRDYRGELDKLALGLDYLEARASEHPELNGRLNEYCWMWNTTLAVANLLAAGQVHHARMLLDGASTAFAEELEKLIWLAQNAQRFPVVDFWASVMGPQIACVLRNMELGLGEGLGCGHGLWGGIRL